MFRLCCDGVPVVLRRYSGYVVTVFRLFWDDVSVILEWCRCAGVVALGWCCNYIGMGFCILLCRVGVSVILQWCIGNVSVMF